MDISEKPLISVIIPVYNAEKYIERCACSLFEQTLQDIEYVFVDDCSTDNSIQILKKCIYCFPNSIEKAKIICHAENKGVAVARNTGLDNAEGKYIGWVDADDWIDRSMYFDMYQLAKKNGSDIVWCDFYNVFSEGCGAVFCQCCNENKIDFIKAQLLGNMHGAMWFSIVRRDIYVLNRIRFPVGLNVMEDKVTLVKLCYFSEKIDYLPKAYYHYIKYNNESITANWADDPTIEVMAKENLLGLYSFLRNTGLDKLMINEIEYSKLIFKRDKLNSLSIQSFKDWRGIFAEANIYVLKCSKMTLKQKMLGWCASNEWWWIVRIWVLIKKGVIWLRI